MVKGLFQKQEGQKFFFRQFFSFQNFYLGLQKKGLKWGGPCFDIRGVICFLPSTWGKKRFFFAYFSPQPQKNKKTPNPSFPFLITPKKKNVFFLVGKFSEPPKNPLKFTKIAKKTFFFLDLIKKKTPIRGIFFKILFAKKNL